MPAGQYLEKFLDMFVALRSGGRGATDVNSARVCVFVCEKINTVKPIEECRQFFGLLSVRAH